MDPAEARRLLASAGREDNRVRRHLVMAAAVGGLITETPVVVGGTAEEYWTNDEYHPTDLDLCGPVTQTDRRRLQTLGFKREGRHWFHPDVPTVAIEFPDSRLDGDQKRVQIEIVEGAEARIIGLDDLYLDRLRQATANPSPGSTEYSSALAVAVARYEQLDRVYLRERLREITLLERQIGQEMSRLDRLIQRRARRALSE